MLREITIANRTIRDDLPTFIVAELSGNHRGELDTALELVDAAASSGADAIKLQTFRPARMAGNGFQAQTGTPWEGQQLSELYAETMLSWSLYRPIMARAAARNLVWFSSPFHVEAIRFLEECGCPCYKIASPEIVDFELIRAAARTGKPLIISTGASTLAEITEASATAQIVGAHQIALLKCTSAYPADDREMNLAAITRLRNEFFAPIGLSDHSTGITAAIAAVVLGARIIEKHLTLDRRLGGPDASFSLEPHEFGQMVAHIRLVEPMLGDGLIRPTPGEEPSLKCRRSLFVLQTIKQGERFTDENLGTLRPNAGMHPRHFYNLLGKRASRDIPAGSPLQASMIFD